MERLTNRDGVWRERMDSDRINRLYKQLAAYENTGFTPGDFDELCRLMSKTRIALGIKTFEELRKAVEGGVIIRLPCALHDPVYVIEAEYKGKKKVRDYVERAQVDCFRIGESGVPVADICTDGGNWYEAMEPKDYYTTREAADAALAAEKEG